jgi:hypothetical protein
MRRLRVLEHSAPRAHSEQSSSEATVVVAEPTPHPGARTSRPIATPPFARRVRYDGIRTMIHPGIAMLIPWIYAVDPIVCAVCLYVECCDLFISHDCTRFRHGGIEPPSSVDLDALIGRASATTAYSLPLR